MSTIALRELDRREIRLDPDLVPTDRLADRWWHFTYQSSRKLHPLEAMRLMKDGAILGGAFSCMPDDVLVFDQTFAKAPETQRRIVVIWYGHRGSAAQKAKELFISRSGLYLQWKAALSYFRGRLHERGLDV